MRSLAVILGAVSMLQANAALLPPSQPIDSVKAGLFTLTHPELCDPRTTVNAILEQYVGILPPVTVDAIRQNLLGKLSPEAAHSDVSEHEAVGNVLASISASSAGNAVTGIELLQTCLLSALHEAPGGRDIECVMKLDALSSAQEILDGVLQQAFGYLPPNLMLALKKVPVGGKDETWEKAMQAIFEVSATGPEAASCLMALEHCLISSLQHRGTMTCSDIIPACSNVAWLN